jgi:3-oxoacyl-[acyl-carrier-protein] synthase II
LLPNTAERENADSESEVGLWFGTIDQGIDQMDFLPAVELDDSGQVDINRFAELSERCLHPMFLLRELPNNGIGHASIQTRCTGPNCNFVGQLAGVQALARAAQSIAWGETKLSVVGAYDSMISFENMVEHHALGLWAATKKDVDVTRVLRPFDVARLGTVPGEGAAALLLEPVDSVVDGRTVLGVVSGVSEVALGKHVGSHVSGEDVAFAVSEVLSQARIDTDDIAFIYVTGDGTHHNDEAEAVGLARAFGGRIPAIPIVSSKPIFGHMGTAAPLLDVAMTLQSLKNGVCPSTKNVDQSEWPLQLGNSTAPRPIRGRHGMVIARTHSGHTAAMVVSV